MGGHGRSKYATRCCTTADHTFQQCILGFKFAVQNLSCACRRHRPRVKPRDLETRMNNRKHPKKQSQEKGIFREKMWEWCATCATQHSVQFESFNLALSLCTLMDVETQSLQSSGKRVSVYCPVDPGNAGPSQIGREKLSRRDLSFRCRYAQFFYKLPNLVGFKSPILLYQIAAGAISKVVVIQQPG